MLPSDTWTQSDVAILFLHICQSNLNAFYFCRTTEIFKNMKKISHTCHILMAGCIWTSAGMFSYNFILPAEFCNDLTADVDQINSKHPVSLQGTRWTYKNQWRISNNKQLLCQSQPCTLSLSLKHGQKKIFSDCKELNRYTTVCTYKWEMFVLAPLLSTAYWKQ